MVERDLIEGHSDKERGVFWRGSFREAMGKEGVFPEASEQTISLVEQLLVGCSVCWDREAISERGALAIIRGSVSKNLIEPSIVGPRLPPLFRQFQARVDPELLTANPVWEEALEDGVKGQDLDLRFIFKQGRSFADVKEVFAGLLGLPEVEDEVLVWEKQGLVIRAQRKTIPVQGEKERKNWRIEFSRKETLDFILDIGEMPDNAVCLNHDTRLGFGGAWHDFGTIAWLVFGPDKENLEVEIDTTAVDYFNAQDSVISLARGDPVVFLRSLVNQAFWESSLDHYRLWCAAGYLKGIQPERKAEDLGLFLKWLFLEPAQFAFSGSIFGLFEQVPLGEALEKRRVSHIRLLENLHFPRRSLQQKLSDVVIGPSILPSWDKLVALHAAYSKALSGGDLSFEDSGPMILLDDLKGLKVVGKKSGPEEILRLLTPY